MTHRTMRPPGHDALAACRSILFVPGDRPDRYGKALAAGADAVCIDLEDAVAPARKAEARGAVAGFLRGRLRGPGDRPGAESVPIPPGGGSGGGVRGGEGVRGGGGVHGAGGAPRVPVVVRVNDLAGSEGARDAATLSACPPPEAFMTPKVRTAADVRLAARRLPAAALLPLIETARGLEHAGRIAVAGPAVAALVFGGFDLAIELGAEPCWEALLHARSRVVHAGALGGVPAIDMPSRDFREMSGLREEAARARRLGFAGKAAIHPAQIPVIHEVFAPSADEVRRARAIVEADRAAGGAAVALKGRMVDRPVVEAARRILQRAHVAPAPPAGQPPRPPPRPAE